MGAGLFWGLNFIRGRATVFVEATPDSVGYVLNTQTNTIEGLMIVPWDITDSDSNLVRVLRVPMRLYDKKTVRGEGESLYEFVNKIGKFYDLPVRWDPEPTAQGKEFLSGRLTQTFKDVDFFKAFSIAVSMVNEHWLEGHTGEGTELDPNTISVGIITEREAVVKKVKSKT